jgi:hypothetical protein
MPGLDGFQTLQLLQQSGAPGVPVVFLSMHEADEIAVEAFRRGGNGYVLKSRAGLGYGGAPRYRVTDVWDALHGILRIGRLDEDVRTEVIAEPDQYRARCAEGETPRLTVFGNTVAPLSREGNTEAMLAVERTWNRLARSLPFLTICAYEAGCFHDEAPGLWPVTCAEHVVLGHASDV